MSWCCVRTHPNAEKIAIRNLTNQDFNYYQGLILERKLYRGKLQHVEAPLFPCYLFVEIVNKWRSLESTYGVAAVIGGSVPSIVRDSVISDLKAREQNGYIQLPKPKKFEVGDQVTINAGAFVGQTALVERMPVRDRQKVLLALLGNKIRALVDERDLEAA